jgi:hypothetical protein
LAELIPPHHSMRGRRHRQADTFKQGSFTMHRSHFGAPALLAALILSGCESPPPPSQTVVVQPGGTASVAATVPFPPPAPQPEMVPPPPPSSGPILWQPGHWRYTSGPNPWMWEGGRYAAVPPGSNTWVPGQWMQVPTGGWTWLDGHWA